MPDDLVWAVGETFPALGHYSFFACRHPYAERRNEGPQAPLASLGLPPQNTESAPLFPLTPAAVRALLTTLQCSRDATARKVAGPPGLVRPRALSGRRGRLHPSLPEAGHPHPESGITTPPSWGRTVTGLSPAGVLPLQAARFVASFSLGSFPHGSQLLLSAEQYARERGCQSVHRETFSFQARPLYEKHGYEVFAQLEDFPPGHTKYFLRKRLVVREGVPA